MLALAIAARFLRSSLAQTILIVAGIGVGIAVLVFVGSLISGLQADLIDTTVGSSPHVTILPEGDGSVTQADADTALEDDRVATAIPVQKLTGIYAEGAESSALAITAGTESDLDSIYGLSDRIVAGEFSLDEKTIVIGESFSAATGIGPDERIALILPDGSRDEYMVSGVFDLGSSAANERLAFLDAASGARALSLDPGEYSAVEIQVDDVFSSTVVAEGLASSGREIVDWQTENEELLAGLAAQSGSSLMIQAFVLVAVALGIASTLAISAVQKTRQIGILKAMGMTDRAAGRIFLLQAAILGFAGVTVGVALGYFLLWGFSFAPVEFSVQPTPTLIVGAVVVGIAVALASSIIPTRSTSRLDPIEVIQSG